MGGAPDGPADHSMEDLLLGLRPALSFSFLCLLLLLGHVVRAKTRPAQSQVRVPLFAARTLIKTPQVNTRSL